MNTHFIAHSPIGPSGRIEWDSWAEMIEAIALARWSGTVHRYVQGAGNLPLAVFRDGFFSGYAPIEAEHKHRIV